VVSRTSTTATAEVLETVAEVLESVAEVLEAVAEVLEATRFPKPPYNIKK